MRVADGGRGSRYGWVRWAYNVGLAVLSPLLLLYLAYRLTIGRRPAAGLLGRLGVPPRDLREACARRGDRPVVWVHAVSVGEVAVADAIIGELRRLRPALMAVVSTTTSTGREVAQKRLPEAEALFYLPFDTPWAVGRTLDVVRPDALVILETEIWPNLLAAARDRGIATVIANGRISDRAFPKFRRFSLLYRWALSNVDLVAAQSQLCAERFIELGAGTARTRVLANVKFDEPMPAADEAARLRLRTELGLAEEHRVVVFGSTAPEEAGALMEAYAHIRARVANARLVVAPRHLQAVPVTVAKAKEMGFAIVLRSDLCGEEPLDDRIIVVDTFGELSTLYSLSDVAFIGRSLVRKGGGNLLQPLAFGVPVLFGPHMQNFREIARAAVDYGVGFEVRDAVELAEVACRLLDSPATLGRVAELSGRFLAENAGGARAHARAILELMDARRPHEGEGHT